MRLRITLDDVQRYADSLPEPQRTTFLQENWEGIKMLYALEADGSTQEEQRDGE